MPGAFQDVALSSERTTVANGEIPVVERRRPRERAGVRVLARERIADVTQSRRQGAARQREHGAVVRACRIIAREFAQPLTGIIAYSEMLITDGRYSSETQQRDVAGVREGALRLERLLQSLRAALTEATIADTDYDAAAIVEQAMQMPCPLQLADPVAG